MFHFTPWFLVANSMTFAKYRYGFDLRQVSPIESMRRTSTPTLLIHGLQDSRTPYWHSQALAGPTPNRPVAGAECRTYRCLLNGANRISPARPRLVRWPLTLLHE